MGVNGNRKRSVPVTIVNGMYRQLCSILNRTDTSDSRRNSFSTVMAR